MDIPDLHPWNLDYQSARDLQTQLRHRLDLTPGTIEFKKVAGCDVSSEWHGKTFFAAVVTLSYPDFTPIEDAVAECEVDFPYIPGLLSFREMPPLLKAFDKLKIRPDVIFCDGSGTIHPRGFGLACHLGLWLGIPAIGTAKNLLCGEHRAPGNDKGMWERVTLNGEVIGAALRTRQGVKPVYVSPGNMLSLEQAVEFTLKCCPRYRITEPVREAHRAANRARESMKIQNKKTNSVVSCLN